MNLLGLLIFCALFPALPRTETGLCLCPDDSCGNPIHITGYPVSPACISDEDGEDSEPQLSSCPPGHIDTRPDFNETVILLPGTVKTGKKSPFLTTHLLL